MDLSGNEIHLYISYPERITEAALLRDYESLLTGEERSQMSRFYYVRHRHQYLVTRALVRTSLSACHEVAPAEWRFGTNGYGKPAISHPVIDSPANFNLSHTRGLIICGIVRHRDIGVDVEDLHRNTKTAFKRLSSYFSEDEIADLARLPPEQQNERFFDYWTLKEAYIKARGMGLAIPLDKFGFQFKADSLDGFTLHPDLDDDAAAWQFWRIPVDGCYRIAVAVNSGNENYTLRAFNSVPLHGNQPLPLTYL